MRCHSFTSANRFHCLRRVPSVAAQANLQASRRTMLAVASGMLLVHGAPAEAFLGIGEDVGKVYTDETSSLLKRTNQVLALDGDEREAAVKELKKEMNGWTAKYRTNGKVGGRPSFSNMYSAVNALAGHWNSFGPDAPIPKKRMTRISKELEDVDKLLARGR